jgi:hypothetical protein
MDGAPPALRLARRGLQDEMGLVPSASGGTKPTDVTSDDSVTQGRRDPVTFAATADTVSIDGWMLRDSLSRVPDRDLASG